MGLPFSHRVSRVPWYSLGAEVYTRLRLHGCYVLWPLFPECLTVSYTSLLLGLFPFRSPLLGKSRFLSFPPATKMFQFAGFPPAMLFYSHSGDSPSDCRVSPFGYLRFVGYVLLTEAFRSLSRPSSAPSARASALCSCSLDLFFFEKITLCCVAGFARLVT